MNINTKTYILLILLLVFYIPETYSKGNYDGNFRKMQVNKEVQKAAKQIYRQAKNLFEEGAYWSCARELIILMDFYSQFEEMDGVVC